MLSCNVATQDLLRLNFLIDRMIESKKPLMLFGPTAQGKSITMRNYVEEHDGLNKAKRFQLIGASLLTTSKKLYTIMEAPLEKTSKFSMQPPEEGHHLYFIDDLHMAYKDDWGH